MTPSVAFKLHEEKQQKRPDVPPHPHSTAQPSRGCIWLQFPSPSLILTPTYGPTSRPDLGMSHGGVWCPRAGAAPSQPPVALLPGKDPTPWTGPGWQGTALLGRPHRPPPPRESPASLCPGSKSKKKKIISDKTFSSKQFSHEINSDDLTDIRIHSKH